ncbi:MAG: hypothetical protein M5R37_14645 [Melioribacteraceae bacterium]|nr:hypothetical protein [Melioribacteraceae bacterium]
MIVDEPLDYCRVKKISEKGYGFLTSLYYSENVFFHFNGIKDPVVKDKLEKMKRGELYFYFTSISKNSKRRVYKLWLDISEVEKELIPDFVKKIIEEFIFGRTNPFEVAYVIKQLRENSKMDFDSFEKILHSDKLLKTPSILLAMLTEKELKNKNTIEELVEQLESQQINSDEWIKLIIGELDYHNHQ